MQCTSFQLQVGYMLDKVNKAELDKIFEELSDDDELIIKMAETIREAVKAGGEITISKMLHAQNLLICERQNYLNKFKFIQSTDNDLIEYNKIMDKMITLGIE